jgi:WD40 repeat protein
MDMTISLWDARQRTLAAQLFGHNDAVGALAFSPDGKRLVSGSRDKTCRIWDVDSRPAPSWTCGATIGKRAKCLITGPSERPCCGRA